MTERPRALVLWYSQSGQLRRAADALVAPLAERGFEVTWQKLQPKREYPFPWTLRTFLGVFPDTVNGRPCELEAPDVAADERFDLVIVAYTVWYLSPSLPAQALFASPLRSVLADTPVVTLIACRNMWFTAEGKMRKLIAAAGGRHVGTVAATDDGPAWATFVTTPRWLLTGKRGRFLRIFPPAGISDASMRALRPFGEALAVGGAAPFEGLDTMSVDRPMVLPDLVIGRLFRPAARALAGARARGGAAAGLGLAAFGVWLVVSVVTTVLMLVVAQLALRPVTSRAIDRNLRRLGARERR